MEGNGSSWRYADVQMSFHSALIVLAGALQSNRTYQFMVQMTSKRNSSLQASGSVLVQVADTYVPLFAVK